MDRVYTWACWNGWPLWHCMGMKLEMLFGAHVLNVREIFAPALSHGKDSGRLCRTAAVRVGPKGQLLSAVQDSGACYPDINHYVIGREASGPGSSQDAGRHFSRCAHRCAHRANWVLRTTVTNGDCALDAMVASLVERTAASRECLRTRIADFLAGVHGCAVWQQILVACEGKDKEVKEAASSSQGGLGPVAGAPGGFVPVRPGTGATSSNLPPPLPPPLYPPP